MKCALCVLKLFIALRRVQTLAAALLVSAVIIGALGAAVPAMQAQQAVVAAPAGSPNAGPPPKAETPPPAESTAEILNRIANSGLPERGAHKAKVTIVFFDDMQCPYCAQIYSTLFNDLMKKYSDRVRVVIRPVANTSIHPWAKRAAIDAHCLAAQNSDAYWDFSDYVHANQIRFGADADVVLDKLAMEVAGRWALGTATLQSCLSTQSDTVLKESYSYLKPLNITAVPTLFIGREKLHGAVPSALVADSIERALHPGPAAPDSSPRDIQSTNTLGVASTDHKISKENPR